MSDSSKNSGSDLGQENLSQGSDSKLDELFSVEKGSDPGSESHELGLGKSLDQGQESTEELPSLDQSLDQNPESNLDNLEKTPEQSGPDREKIQETKEGLDGLEKESIKDRIEEADTSGSGASDQSDEDEAAVIKSEPEAGPEEPQAERPDSFEDASAAKAKTKSVKELVQEILAMENVEDQIKVIEDIVKEEGPYKAMEIADHLNSNYLLDETHDKLSELRDFLVEKGYLKEVR